MFKFNRKIHKSVSDLAIVEVIEVDGVRSLYLGSVTIQSSMRVRVPLALELAYSRGMMCFLLFKNNTKHVLSIGLGGGSVPKFIHAFCPTITQTIVEINPQIINTAHSHFFVPNNDERLTVIEGDGLVHLSESQNSADVLMIDAFDALGIPPGFCSQDFFDSCEATLKHDGIFVINLWGSDKNFDIYLRRIEQSFDDKVLMLPTGKPGNIVVFGFKDMRFKAGLDIPIIQLRERAKALEAQFEKPHAIEFLSFLEKLCDHNPHNNKQFFIESV
jgi:spermidine synthase